MTEMIITVVIGVMLAGVGLTAAVSSNRAAAARHQHDHDKAA